MPPAHLHEAFYIRIYKYAYIFSTISCVCMYLCVYISHCALILYLLSHIPSTVCISHHHHHRMCVCMCYHACAINPVCIFLGSLSSSSADRSDRVGKYGGVSETFQRRTRQRSARDATGRARESRLIISVLSVLSVYIYIFWFLEKSIEHSHLCGMMIDHYYVTSVYENIQFVCHAAYRNVLEEWIWNL